jgi:ketosteroid isomerase-like protein
MTSENVEIVRRGYEHFAATGEFRPEMTDPDFVWDMSTFRGWPEQKAYAGLEGAKQFITAWSAAWEDWQLDIEELIDAGEDHVLAIVRQRGRSKSTGLTVEMYFAQLWTMRDGKQVRMEMYADPAEGRRAAGLDTDESPGSEPS